jgi:hypothetical protein
MSNKAHRALAIARRKSMYAAQPSRTTQNKKRVLARQVRRFPEDTQAVTRYVQKYGDASLASVLAQRHAKAVKRAARRHRPKAKKVTEVSDVGAG